MEWLIAVKEVVFAVFLPKKFVKNRTTYLRFLYNHELMLLITYLSIVTDLMNTIYRLSLSVIKNKAAMAIKSFKLF